MSDISLNLIKAGATDSNAYNQRKLKKAVQGFESMFLLQLLKSMRTAYTSGNEKGGLGQDTFFSLCDQALADQLGKDGALGIGDILMKELGERYLNDSEKSDFKRTDPRHLPLKKSESPAASDGYKKVYDAYMKLNRDDTSTPDIFYTFEPNSPGYQKILNQLNQVHHNSNSEQTEKQISEAVTKAAKQYNLPENLLQAVIEVESDGNPQAVSSKGAKGLMQLVDSTANNLGVENVFEPEDNIMGGAKYLRQLLTRFKGDLKLALAAYNAGPANVEKFGGIPPFAETQEYVSKVVNIMSINDIGSKDSKTLADIE